MKLMRPLSKTEQVVDFLREEIKTEKLFPGSKLQSSRVLAEKFASSKKVVESAYNILEAEGLVFKRARSGVFVNKVSELSHIKEVYILGIGIDNDDFFSNILKMTYPPLLHNNFSFTTKTYSLDIPVNKVLDIESNRINKMSEIDAVLINAAPLAKKDIEKCLKINKPVIFIGDCKIGTMEDIEFNQITGDNEYNGSKQIKFMHDYDHKNITLFSGSLDHLFNCQFYDAAQKESKKLGIKFNIVEFPSGITSLPIEKRISIMKEIVKKAILKKQIYSGIIISGIDIDLIKNRVKKIDPILYKKLSFIPPFTIEYNEFHKTISMRIKELIINKNKTKKIRIKQEIVF